MQQYLEALQHIIDNGDTRMDRTGTGTVGVFGMQQRYDLRKGFPAMTTKKLAWKAVVSELLWFIEGSGDEGRLREILYGDREARTDHGVLKKTIWTANAQADYWKPKAKYDGDLQRVYGYQWRKWGGNYDKWPSKVELVKQGDKTGTNVPFNITFPILSPDSDNSDILVGSVMPTKHCGDVRVVQKLPTKKGNSYYKVQFLHGVNAIVECSRPNLKNGMVQNPYAMSICNGSGCYGIITKRSKYITAAYNMWYNMMERCHGNNPIKTLYYKDKGVFVDSDWRCFSNFYRDIHGLVGFDQWASNPSNFDLDKDYFGNNFYGRESTIFIPSWYNMHILPKVDGDLYTAVNKKTKEIFRFSSPAFFNKLTNSNGVVDRAFLNQNGETRVWKFTKEPAPAGYAWRQKFFIDQLADLIAGIKKDPFGRRHLLTAWNPGELSEMALPPCHIMAQFYVNSKNELSCQMYQRSADVPLGVPFNIASYALLTHMIAQVSNLGVGEFIHTTGDSHIYLNQVDGVTEQLMRSPLPLPTLWINPDIKNIDDFCMTDFRLDNYQHHAPIDFPFAV